MEFKSPVEALAMALALAITAPSEELMKECVGMGNSIAAGLSKAQVEQAKEQALKLVEEWEGANA